MNEQLIEFGRHLQKAREAKGLTRATLAGTTKIQEMFLMHLEAGRVDALPAMVFAEGFVKAYARACGLDIADTVARLRRAAQVPDPIVVKVEEAAMADAQESAPMFSVPPAEVLDPRRKMGVALVVLLLLIMATVTLSMLLGGGTTPLQPIS